MSIFDRTVTPLEPFDLSTPRLTFEEIGELVGALDSVTLATLAMGPKAHGCRLCASLRDQEVISGSRKSEIAVDLLRAYHDNLDLSSSMLAALYDRDGWAPKPIDDARHGILGNLAYARCSTIYAVARVELVRRVTNL